MYNTFLKIKWVINHYRLHPQIVTYSFTEPNYDEKRAQVCLLLAEILVMLLEYGAWHESLKFEELSAY